MTKALILVIIAECWLTTGQIFLKKSADRLSAEHAEGKSWISQLLGCILRFPSIWMGGVAMLIGLLFWFAALSSGALSAVYLLGSIQYILTLIAAHYFLKEKINAPKIIGTLLITMGIILTAIS